MIKKNALPIHRFFFFNINRDGSACLSYNLEREENDKSLVEKWIAYKSTSFEGEELAFRQQQLQIRTRECSQTLDLLFKLNAGAQIEHILQPTIDFGMFKVIFAKCRNFKQLI